MKRNPIERSLTYTPAEIVLCATISISIVIIIFGLVNL